MKRSLIVVVLFALALGPIACHSSPAQSQQPKTVAFPAIDGSAVLGHVKVLASDEYEGRAPGTKGEDLTVAYIADQFKKVGLEPGNPDGTYLQRVPLVAITPDPSAVLTLKKGAKEQKLKFRDDVVAWTKRVQETVGIDKSEIVFIGYGVQAPEFNWDDYKGMDLKGKTLLVLVGDPPVPDPANRSELDPKVFGGRAITYYGRWTYKYEMGQKMGAASVLIVHETRWAGYPWAVVQSKSGEQCDLMAPDKNMSRLPIEGWVTLEQTKKLFAMAGQDFDTLKAQALTREFKPVPLGVAASLTLHNTIRTFDSQNVIGKVEGNDPVLKDEFVIFTAHWDHFGIGAPFNGDRIYHGAIDNATGVGALIEVGRAFAAMPVRPKRTTLFLAPTAEEAYVMGSRYYSLNPLYPLARTLGVLNMDILNVHGRTRDIIITGFGYSDLDDYAREVAAMQGRVVRPDPAPESGFFFRSDHFPFAMQGVPGLWSWGGTEVLGKPPEWGRQARAAYDQDDYHHPSDVVRPDWDVSGFTEDAQYYWMLGYKVAQADKYPGWKPGAEFAAIRETQLKASGSQERR
jgi:Zn-dependent M28 family amino/carboxypeptidase